MYYSMQIPDLYWVQRQHSISSYMKEDTVYVIQVDHDNNAVILLYL